MFASLLRSRTEISPDVGICDPCPGKRVAKGEKTATE